MKTESIELEVIEFDSEDYVDNPKCYPHIGVFLVKTPIGKHIVKVDYGFHLFINDEKCIYAAIHLPAGS